MAYPNNSQIAASPVDVFGPAGMGNSATVSADAVQPVVVARADAPNHPITAKPVAANTTVDADNANVPVNNDPLQEAAANSAAEKNRLTHTPNIKAPTPKGTATNVAMAKQRQQHGIGSTLYSRLIAQSVPRLSQVAQERMKATPAAIKAGPPPKPAMAQAPRPATVALGQTHPSIQLSRPGAGASALRMVGHIAASAVKNVAAPGVSLVANAAVSALAQTPKSGPDTASKSAPVAKPARVMPPSPMARRSRFPVPGMSGLHC